MPAENASYINFFAGEQGVSASEKDVSHAVEIGLALLLGLAEADENKRSAFLAIRAKNNLDGYVSQALGERFTSQLHNCNRTEFTDPDFPGVPIELRLMTETNEVPGSRWPILAIHPMKALMDRIHARQGVPDLIVVPWIQQDIAQWIEAQGPESVDFPVDIDDQVEDVDTGEIRFGQPAAGEGPAVMPSNA